MNLSRERSVNAEIDDLRADLRAEGRRGLVPDALEAGQACRELERPHDSVQSMDAPLRQPVDFELESSSGVPHGLREHRGQVVVVFYESRDRLDDNAALKRSLERFSSTTVASQLAVLAVGDVKAFDFAPARSIARSAIRAIASHYDLEILLDWKGVLARAPFSLDPAKSNVLVVDREGLVVYRHAGVIAAAEEARFLGIVRGCLGLDAQLSGPPSRSVPAPSRARPAPARDG